MLSIVASVSGVALVATSQTGAQLELTYSVQDSDPFIALVTASVDWGDGRTEATGQVGEPYGPITLVHGYAPGTYVVRVTAANFRSPRPDVVVYQQTVTVTLANATRADAPAVVFGPILPRTQGFPSTDTWAFNIGRDGVILESSLRMLLLTRRGERLFDPGYGTALNALVFALAGDDLGTAVRTEIVQAVTAYETRVQFVGSSVQRVGKTINVTAEFKSLLSNQPVVLNLAFTQ